MHNKHQIVQRLLEKDKESLSELYDSYIRHITNVLYTTSVPRQYHEKIIVEMFQIIWFSPDVLINEKHMSVSITKLCIDLTKTTFPDVS
ncbi:hypothetical protein [Guptibacillus spartinae]|uniref:hypothetical protein n=1 Tax=Guptibacillus spartinae TaxID=3025679 RepID=UPI00236227FC|nr:hypothetical protein [Pseudalkalibacillus spartinae]